MMIALMMSALLHAPRCPHPPIPWALALCSATELRLSSSGLSRLWLPWTLCLLLPPLCFLK